MKFIIIYPSLSVAVNHPNPSPVAELDFPVYYEQSKCEWYKTSRVR
jgi:hypothetical protein